MKFFYSFLLSAYLLTTHLSAQQIIALGGGGDIHEINPQTGVTNLIGWTGHHSNEWTGLAQNSIGELYAATGDWISNFSIYRVDPQTGAGTFILQTSLSGISCMAFGPDDTLFVGHDPIWPLGGGVYDLYTINLATGAETLIGSTGIVNLLALDFKGDQLYGQNSFEGLVRIDTSTGIATDVNPNFSGPVGTTMSMCFDDSGALYYLDHALWVQDSRSGIRSPIDWVSSSNIWGETTFVEGSKPNFALWLNGTAGHFMEAKMTGITPNGQVAVLWAKGEGGPSPIPSGFPCAGTPMDLHATMKLLAVTTADSSGFATIGPGPSRVPPSAAGLVWLQALDLGSCSTSNRVLLYF